MDAREKSFDSARDSSRLVITLATGVIAFTVTFAKEVGGLRPSSTLEASILLVSWGGLFMSIVFGVWTQLAITDVLDSAWRRDDNKPSIWANKIRVPFQLQLVAFLVGIAAMAVYGVVRVLAPGQ